MIIQKKQRNNLVFLSLLVWIHFFLIETEENIYLFFLYEGKGEKIETLMKEEKTIKVKIATYAQLKKDYPEEFKIKENLEKKYK